MPTPRITIVGSINMDLVTTVTKFPKQGETVLGKEFHTSPGGKGANQAVAAARLGADVSIIGKVGHDAFGKELYLHLKKEGIQMDGVAREESVSTGIANIILYDGDNRIMVVPGANHAVTPDYVEQCKDKLLGSDMVLMQLEIPLETIKWCADFCYEHGIPYIINPAPAAEIPEAVWTKSLYITPNEEEAAQLFGINEDKYKSKLIKTLGSKGAQYKDKIIPGYQSKVVDTTGAGDTFNGALAFYVASGLEVENAIRRANIAASIAIERMGAQEGMPTYDEVKERLES
ncbi:ribokinase [Oceanobacillus piezotolerans]|uniref:Ribokinase n=1 Tax=Oceanobacillus piezotolerans TaxID=2448030 RepID=A0A498DRA0_9BACI|nr:ribokinase [Oceanobacillus piezotolerans]RLL46989.1 ribokinase [Oceanobacillus piezotolerans]